MKYSKSYPYFVILSLSIVSMYFLAEKFAHAQSLPAFQLQNLTDETGQLDQTQFLGRVSVLNIWASWCPVCRSEHAFLLNIAKTNQVPMFGIDLKDARELARNYLQAAGNPYRVVGADTQGIVSEKLGIQAIPQTLLIDKKGIIRYQYAGALDAHIWETQIRPRLFQYINEP